MIPNSAPRARPPRTEDRFLGVLAATANVKLACAAAGLSVASAYVHRRKWPAFARRWQAALETGYLRLEFAMVANGCSAFEPGEGFDPDLPMPPMNYHEAITLLRLHRHGVSAGSGGRPGRAITRLRDPAAARAAILRSVAALQRGHAAGLKVRGEG